MAVLREVAQQPIDQRVDRLAIDNLVIVIEDYHKVVVDPLLDLADEEPDVGLNRLGGTGVGAQPLQNRFAKLGEALANRGDQILYEGEDLRVVGVQAIPAEGQIRVVGIID